jgi:dihydrolipoamide dehydrogenase
MSDTVSSVLVLGGGPAGIFSALRAAEHGASTTLIASGQFGGMAANDGPVPVRTLAHAARLMREAQQLELYGICVGKPQLDYALLLERVKQVVSGVTTGAALRPQLNEAGVQIRESVGNCRFIDHRTVQSPSGERFTADRIIVCTGGKPRALNIPGAEHVASHSGAWGLTSVPESMLVIGAGATGLQVASIFAAFGTRVSLFELGPRILPREEEDVSSCLANGFRQRGISVHENIGAIDCFEATATGVRMVYTQDGARQKADAVLAIAAVGWQVDAEELGLAAAGIETDERGYIRVDDEGRTSVAHIFAAGDAIGGAMLVPQAMQEGFIASSTALGLPAVAVGRHVIPVGSFTDPEYARAGMTEAQARRGAPVMTCTVPFESVTRPIIDGRTFGFCKLIADRSTRLILGCSIVGERAVDIVQVAAVAMAAEMRVDELAYFPLSFPIYAGVLSQAAAKLTYRLNREQ